MKTNNKIQSINKFETICKLASDNNWCWSLHCSTCPNADFLEAFLDVFSISQKNNLSWEFFNDHEKDTIFQICADANLVKIAQTCNFPSWLGYLGIILERLKTDSQAYQALSISWAKQLSDMVYLNPHLSNKLNNILKNKAYLSIEDLEDCEHNMSIERRFF